MNLLCKHHATPIHLKLHNQDLPAHNLILSIPLSIYLHIYILHSLCLHLALASIYILILVIQAA